MVGKRQLEQDPLVTVVVPNTAARSLHLCQLFEELLKDNFESESSKLTGTYYVLVRTLYLSVMSLLRSFPSWLL